MKINWGTGIVIGMVAFISFIMYFVITMMSSPEFEHDMVVEDYYREELHFQQDIDAEENALALDHNISLKRENLDLFIVFPEQMNLQALDGKVTFYRPSNKKLDFNIPFSEIKTNRLKAPEAKMVKGRWNIKIIWEEGDKEYLFKEEIVY